MRSNTELFLVHIFEDMLFNPFFILFACNEAANNSTRRDFPQKHFFNMLVGEFLFELLLDDSFTHKIPGRWYVVFDYHGVWDVNRRN